MPPSPAFPTGRLEVSIAAKGARLVVVGGEDTAGLLARVLDTAEEDGTPPVEVEDPRPVNGRVWVDVKKAVPLLGRLAGDPDPTTRMLLGLAGLVFEKGRQQLSVSVRTGRKGLLVRVEAPPGFYAIVGQLLNAGLGQVQRGK